MDVQNPISEAPSAKPKRRRCQNCNRLFLPKLNWVKRVVRFCCDACRKEFHHHGSAFGPLKITVEKMITARFRELREQFAEIERRVKRLESR